MRGAAGATRETQRYKAYPEYKDSGVEWIGEIPAHWGVGRFKNHFIQSNEKNGSRIVGEMLSVSGYRGIEIKEYDDEGRKRTEEELVDYRVVRKGQLVVNTMWLNYAGLGVSDYDGHVSPAYRSYWFLDDTDKKYIHYLLRSPAYVSGYTKYMQGIRPNSLQIKTEDFVVFSVVLPSLLEQQAIATFLDYETTKIDHLIAKQEQLIALLKEKRQAVISHAVTKGLNPNAPMKDSGVEWLGEVPEHWGVAPSYAYFQIRLGKMLDARKISGELLAPYLRNIDVRWNEVRLEDLPSMDFDTSDRIRYSLRRGDLLVCEGGEVGRCAIWKGADFDCYYQKALHRMRPLVCDTIYIKYIYYCFEFFSKGGIFNAGSNQPTFDHLTAEQLRVFRFPIPPLAEQANIATFLDEQSGQLQDTENKALSVIELLKEHRSSLITAAVTGKIDVRDFKPEASHA
jgi:type I restriction enzyme S subunit